MKKSIVASTPWSRIAYILSTEYYTLLKNEVIPNVRNLLQRSDVLALLLVELALLLSRGVLKSG